MAGRPGADLILLGDNLELLPTFADESFHLVYVDPPFNTGREQRRRTLKTVPDSDGDRVGFQGHRYRTPLARRVVVPRLVRRLPRLSRAPSARGASPARRDGDAVLPHRLSRGALLQAPARRALRPRVLPQRDHLGLRLRRAGATALAGEARHDPRVRQGPRAVPLRRRRGRPRSRTWRPGSSPPRRPRAASFRRTSGGTRSCPPTGKEKTGYPTQKPEGIVRRMVLASTRPGDWCLDFFAGSGTLGAVAAQLGRRYVLIDSSVEAVTVARKRLAPFQREAARVVG